MQEEDFTIIIDSQRKNLFDKYVNLVYKLASRMDYGYVEKEDLIQVGLMGLYNASMNFDFSKGNNFISYASVYIISEMKKELRENKLISMNKEMYRLVKELSIIDTNLSLEEISEKLKTTKENVLLALQYKNKVMSLNVENDDLELVNLIESKDETNYWLLRALEKLNNIEKEVINCKYFYGFSQQEISKRFNKSQSFVSRVEKKALIKLRKFIGQ